jgi:hypothetical protein
MDLKELRTAYSDDSQVVTIYLGTRVGQANAYQELEARWDDMLARVADVGVDPLTVKALHRARRGHREGGTQVLVAAGGSVRYARHLPDAVDIDIVRVSALPYLLPLVAWGQSRVPHLVALVDRLGADVLAYRDDPRADEESVVATSVEATPHPWHKTGKGGWSAARYEHRVEEDWKTGARAVADLLEKTAASIGASLLVMAGDPKAVALVRGQLPAALDTRTRLVSGGRADDGSEEIVAGQVADLLLDQTRRDVAEALAEFDQRRRRHAERPTSIVLDGPAETVAALAEGRVATLLLSDDLEDDAPIFFGPRPTDLALHADDLHGLRTPPRQGAFVDGLLRAAIGTDAGILIVPADQPESPRDGVGALPRYDR